MGALSDKDKQYLLSLKREDISQQLIQSLFADTAVADKDGKRTVKKSRIEPSDTFVLKKGEFINKTEITTTAGRFIFNKLIIEDLMSAFDDYLNITIGGDGLKKCDTIMSQALLKDKVTVQQYIDYLNRIQWLGLSTTSMFCSSFTKNILMPQPKVIQRRNALIKEHRKDIDDGNIIEIDKIEKECLALAASELSKDEGMLLFKSGARGTFGNNYKNISVMKGPILNPNTGKWDVVETNYIEGMAKKDIAPSANAIVTGAYPKAIGQRTFGHLTKQLTAVLQSVVLDKPGYDCNSKVTIRTTITEKNKKLFVYRYIVENGKLVFIDDENISKYFNKEVNMRTPMFCASDTGGICRTCAGKIYEMFGIENIGLTGSRASSTMSNASMKKFHDSTAKTAKINKNLISI